MFKLSYLHLFLSINLAFTNCQGQHKNETVASIQKLYEDDVKKEVFPLFKKKGFDAWPTKISLVALKEERALELWAKNKASKWVYLKTYEFTAYSGQLGPKLKQGDLQIPEGIYKITWLHPNSSYHLSMKVNYPNTFDKSKAKQDNRVNLGGDIFIHGSYVTIGCIPIGDNAIEELFIIVSKAHKNGIEVIISPRDFRKEDKRYPNISNVKWERELYDKIKKNLKVFVR